MDIKKSSILIVILLLFSIKCIHADISKEITILPTIKAPFLLQVNEEATAQFAIKNLSQKTVTLAMIPQKGVTQDTTGLLACAHPFILHSGQECLLNLKIKWHEVDHKIRSGPLVCKTTSKGRVKPDNTFCVQPTIQDSFDITIVKAEKVVIEVKPQALNIHAASVSPMELIVINHSETITAHNITANLPDSWNDVNQNAKDCLEVKPNESCNILFTAERAHSLKIITVSGDNTTKVPVKIRVEPHEVEKFGPPD